jgi:hypothetical protein
VSDVLKPAPSLLIKLGSALVHADELTSPLGHAFDRVALEQLIADPEVVAWRKEMRAMGLLPEMRNER